MQHLILAVLLLFSLPAISDESVTDSAYDELAVFNDVSLSYGSGEVPLYVFVSPTCPYCRKFHTDVLDGLIEYGLNVRYLLIGEGGTSAYKKAAEIYCAKDPKRHLAGFKAFLSSGEPVDGAGCESIVDDMNMMAALYDIKGTPMIVYPNGKVSFGVSDAQTVLKTYLSNSF